MNKNAEPVYNQRVFVVFESCLLLLFSRCIQCLNKCSPVLVMKSMLVKITTICSKGHTFIWHSQPPLDNTRTAPFNLLLASSILFSGCNPTTILRIFKFCKMPVFDRTTFFRIQNKFLFPAVQWAWKHEQTTLINNYSGKEIVLGGDARCDSPGYSAKYAHYTFMEVSEKKVIHLELLQSNEVTSSNAMEKEGLIRGLKFLANRSVEIKTLVTDRHIQIRALMKKEYKKIEHVFDCWHVSKGFKKKILAAAKVKDCSILSDWLKSLNNHLYYCPASSNGDGKLASDKWMSILRHVINEHEGHDDFIDCAHDQLDDETIATRKWIDDDSLAFAKLKTIVTNLKKDVAQMSSTEQTSLVEVFHGVMNHFLPKSTHYSYEGMKNRGYLAALHFNENGDKEVAVDETGDERFDIVHPKAKGGEYSVKPIKVKNTYDYVNRLQIELFNMVPEKILPFCKENDKCECECAKRPKPLAASYSHPDKALAKELQQSRFNKKK